MILAAALALADIAPGCYLPARGETIVERRILHGRTARYEAVSISRTAHGTYQALDGRMIVFGPRCARLFERDFGNAWEVRFQTARLGAEPVLLATAITPGASSSGYRHLLLGYGAGLRDLSPAELETSTADGLFVGDLGAGRGPGLAQWQGLWSADEAHYSPHRFRVTFWRWQSGRLVRSGHYVTRRRLDSRPDAAAGALGFSFRDMTRTERFALTNRIIYEEMRPRP